MRRGSGAPTKFKSGHHQKSAELDFRRRWLNLWLSGVTTRQTMKCPYCNHTFALTWKEYFWEARGHHNCVACKRRFKLSYSWSYLAIAVLIALIIAGLAMFLVARWTHSRIAAVGGLVIVLVVLLALDRWLDDHWRKSAPLEPDEPKT
jgi:hypothetical protein